jgi:hypothetical protein
MAIVAAMIARAPLYATWPKRSYPSSSYNNSKVSVPKLKTFKTEIVQNKSAKATPREIEDW